MPRYCSGKENLVEKNGNRLPATDLSLDYQPDQDHYKTTATHPILLLSEYASREDTDPGNPGLGRNA